MFDESKDPEESLLRAKFSMISRRLNWVLVSKQSASV
jgi:hypothetical protein